MDPLTLTGVTLHQAMFAYSGVDKLHGFDAKVTTLVNKVAARTTIQLPRTLAALGMVGVILLEVLGSLYLVLYAAYATSSPTPPAPLWRDVTRVVIVLMVLFVVVVTFLYHPPINGRVIPLLSNTTTAAGFLLMWRALGL